MLLLLLFLLVDSRYVAMHFAATSCILLPENKLSCCVRTLSALTLLLCGQRICQLGGGALRRLAQPKAEMACNVTAAL